MSHINSGTRHVALGIAWLLVVDTAGIVLLATNPFSFSLLGDSGISQTTGETPNP